MIKKRTKQETINDFTTISEILFVPQKNTTINMHTDTFTHAHTHTSSNTISGRPFFPQMGYDNPIRRAIMLKQSKHGQLQSILLDAD